MNTSRIAVITAGLLTGLAGCSEENSTSNPGEAEPEVMEDQAIHHNALSEAEQAEGWQLLFDGKTTAGWRNYKSDTMGDQWKVVDGALTLTAGGGGNIQTVGQYRNFDWKWEWKISPRGNSGAFFHIQEGDEPRPYWTAPEYQLLDNSRGEKPIQQAGSLYDLYARSADVTKPVGEWNSSRIKYQDGNVEFWMNGELMVSADLNSDEFKTKVADSKFGKWPRFGATGSGHLGLQDHDDWVAFRNIKVLDLDK